MDTKVFLMCGSQGLDRLPRLYSKASLMRATYQIVHTSVNRLKISVYTGWEPHIYESLSIEDILCVLFKNRQKIINNSKNHNVFSVFYLICDHLVK